MDWKIFGVTFGTIFLAELGDKTQLANFSLVAKSGSRLSVFVASVLAFCVVTLITVLLGSVMNKYIKPEYIRCGAASLFVLVGLLMFLGKI